MAAGTAAVIGSYIALGDSFTEGLDDPYPQRDGQRGTAFRGWADRLAELLAAQDPGFRYANLAVRGKLLDQVVREQVPAAIAAGAGLVTLCAGGNDVMRSGADPDAMAVTMLDAVQRLRATGADVVLFTGVDPRNVPLLRRVGPRVAAFNKHLRMIAGAQGCRLVDMWAMDTLYDWRAWSEDRLHLSAAGHRRVALHVAELLGVDTDGDWREPWPPAEPTGWTQRRWADAVWVRRHLAPWIGRRLRGRSSGDGLAPKRPELTPLR